MDELTRARIETIVTMSDDILMAILKNGEVHGLNDPNMAHIVSSALTMVIRDIDRLGPGFTKLMIKMLQAEKDESYEE